MIAHSIKQNDVSICTAGKLLEEIRSGLTFEKISLMIFDECHHAQKCHPYAQLLEHCLEYQKTNPHISLPQIVGMTASPGAGENFDMDREKTVDHLLKLAALLNATSGFKIVANNVEELSLHTKHSSQERIYLRPRTCSDDSLIRRITAEMTELEKYAPIKAVSSSQKWSLQYESSLQQVKLRLETGKDKDVRNYISTLNLLRCYCKALRVYMDLEHQDAIEEIESNTGFPEDDSKATPHESIFKQRMKDLVRELKRFPPKENHLLTDMFTRVTETYKNNPLSRAIIFVPNKKYTHSLRRYVIENQKLKMIQNLIIKPEVIMGRHTTETGHGMTQVDQKAVIERFNTGITNLLIATSVVEEGLDVAECNLVVRYQYITNEIGQVQVQGRARAENSMGITIFSSDSLKKYRELKNEELASLVNSLLDENPLPVDHELQEKIKEIQSDILENRRLKAAMKSQRRKGHEGSSIKLFCKSCKTFACRGIS